jgi:hypothetical protein
MEKEVAGSRDKPFHFLAPQSSPFHPLRSFSFGLPPSTIVAAIFWPGIEAARREGLERGPGEMGIEILNTKRKKAR